jgi:hypothetical protein
MRHAFTRQQAVYRAAQNAARWPVHGEAVHGEAVHGEAVHGEAGHGMQRETCSTKHATCDMAAARAWAQHGATYTVQRQVARQAGCNVRCRPIDCKPPGPSAQHVVQHRTTGCNVVQHRTTGCNVVQHRTTGCNVGQHQVRAEVATFETESKALDRRGAGGSLALLGRLAWKSSSLAAPTTVCPAAVAMQPVTHAHAHTHAHARKHARTRACTLTHARTRKERSIARLPRLAVPSDDGTERNGMKHTLECHAPFLPQMMASDGFGRDNALAAQAWSLVQY